MANILHIFGEINEENTKQFIKEFNSFTNSQASVAEKNKASLEVYISSTGGYVDYADVIINMLSQYSKDFHITLIASGTIYSAAFNIFFFSNVSRKIILDDTVGMAHFSWANLGINEKGTGVSEEDKFLLQEFKKNSAKNLERFKSIGLNSKELAKIKKGGECYIGTERLKELIQYG